jgi:protein ImuA
MLAAKPEPASFQTPDPLRSFQKNQTESRLGRCDRLSGAPAEEGGERDPAPAAAPRLGDLRAVIRAIEDRPAPRWSLGGAGGTGSDNEPETQEFCPATPVRPLGAAEIDDRLGGGFPEAGLSELRVAAVRDAGAGLGFALALAVLLGATARRPLVWIAPAATLSDAGYPYRPGLAGFGLDPAALVVVRARRLEEALWAAEEAARSGAPALTLLEVQNNPAQLSLEGSRRLHWRARAAGRPILLLRQGGFAESTAAPLRLGLSAGPSAGPPRGLTGPETRRLLGAPAFTVSIEKSRDGRLGQVCLEWNPHERRFQTIRPAALSRPVLSTPPDGPAAPAALRPLLALGDGGAPGDGRAPGDGGAPGEGGRLRVGSDAGEPRRRAS